MILGQYIGEVKQRRGLSQWEWSHLRGMVRCYISRPKFVDYPSAMTFFLILPRVPKVNVNDIYAASGYHDGNL